MDARSIDLTRSADLVVRKLLAVRPGEEVAIVCDPHTEIRIARALAGIVESVGAEYTLLTMPTRTAGRKNELTGVVEAGLGAADCLIGLTGASGAPTYAGRVKELLDERRLRALSLVMRDVDNFTGGGALADYEALREEGEALARRWRKAGTIRIETPAGTELEAGIRGEDVIVECGFATEPGVEAAFSDGEVSQMPRRGTAAGSVVVDGPVAHLGPPGDPIRLEVAGGEVTAVRGGGGRADELRRIVETVENAANVAEIGIGLNPMSRRNGDFEEEKKARGNVHVALGDNVFYGGDVTSPVHIDMVLYQPTVWFDEEVVVREGEFRMELP